METQKQTTSANNDKCNNDVVACNDNTGILLHLESWDKMMKIPVVDAAWHQSQGIYGKVKGMCIFCIQFNEIKSLAAF